MPIITGTIFLDNGEEYTFEAEKDMMQVTSDVSDEKWEEIMDEINELIDLA